MLTDRQFSVFEWFTKAFACLFDGRIILRILLPFIIAGIICLILLFATWGPGIELFESLLQSLGWLSVAVSPSFAGMDGNGSKSGFMAGLIFLFLSFVFLFLL